MSNPEQQPNNTERNVETPRVPESQYEKLNNVETAGELAHEKNERQAEQKQAEKEAIEVATKAEKPSVEKEKKTTTRRKGTITKKEREASFKRHMTQVQSQLPLPQRVFSQFIHNSAVEKTSEFIGSTVARPNAILSGAVTAFVLVLAVYLLAKNLGYVLSGFETIGAFIVGWVLGIIYDYLRVMVTGKK